MGAGVARTDGREGATITAFGFRRSALGRTAVDLARRLLLSRRMSRDYKKLRVFVEADELVLALYPATVDMPVEERYGLKAQLRRAAVSTATNIVEGSSRGKTRDYCRFIEVALGSARECHYLLRLAVRLRMLASDHVQSLIRRYDRLEGSLNAMVNVLQARAAEEKRQRRERTAKQRSEPQRRNWSPKAESQ